MDCTNIRVLEFCYLMLYDLFSEYVAHSCLQVLSKCKEKVEKVSIFNFASEEIIKKISVYTNL